MIRYFAAHPTAANVTMALIMVIGLVLSHLLLRETFPRVAPREVQITVPYPGAAPQEVSQAICTRIEDALDGMRHLDEVRCDAFENRAIAIAEMRQGGDFARFTADIEAEIRGIGTFPDTVEEAEISQLGLNDIVAVVTLTAEGAHDLTELNALAEDVKTRMLRWGGIPKVDVAGFADPEIRIEIKEEAAQALSLSLDEIARIIERQNTDLPLGELVSQQGSLLLRFADERRSVDAYRDIVIASSQAGGEVRLGDIASVFESVEDREVAAELNGQPAAILRITKAETDDTLRVMHRLETFLDDERAHLPPGVTLTVTGDAAGVLDDRLSMMIRNSLQGLLLVFVVMWVFFGLRQAFWIAAGLPVSFLGALAAMAFLGYSINMLTLVALLIVIGILMDDAIVISENIETKRAEGLPPLEAAVTGAWEVAPGVMTSFVTTAAVFGSLAFLEGDLGELLKVVPIVMLIVLIVSLVEAFLILPAHLCHGAPEHADPPRRADRWMDTVRQRIVGPVVRASVAWRWLTLGVAFLAFLASIAAVLGGALKFEAFPNLDGDQIEARLALQSGSSIESTKAAMAHVLAGLDRVDAAYGKNSPDAQPLVRDIVVTYGENADIGGSGAHLATARIDILGTETRGASLEEILAAWRAEVTQTPGISRLSLIEGVRGPAGRAIEIQLAHDELTVLEDASASLRMWLSRYQGAYNIADDLSAGRPEMHVTMRDQAASLGLDARAVADQLRAGFQGIVADEIAADRATWDVEVRLRATDRTTLSDLEDLAIQIPTGAQVPLHVVADITESRGHAVQRRVDAHPVATITGDVDTRIGNADEIIKDTVARFLPELKDKHPGLTVEIKGASAAAETTQLSMASGLAIGLLVVFVVLSFQLRSYAEPIVVMAIIPFALIGAIAGHFALGINVSMPSFLGVAALSGIVVNDSILLVHVIKEKRERGLSVAEAAPLAAMARFRAIFLTSLTTVAGVIPLMFETSLQAQPLIPLVTSIAFGLISTTLLILLVVPAFYAALDELELTEPTSAEELPIQSTNSQDGQRLQIGRY